MALALSLDHIILPKDVTDGFYSTWHNYYGELFPSPVKPKYRPMSKILSCDDDSITQSSPNLFEKVTTPVGTPLNVPSPLATGSRVGDNIDEFIWNNRRKMFRSSSLNDLMQEFGDNKLFLSVLSRQQNQQKQQQQQQNQKQQDKHLQQIAEKHQVKLRSKSDLTQSAVRKSNRFSWCGSQTIKFLTSLQGKRKTYECMSAAEKFQQENYDSSSINDRTLTKEK